MRSIRRATLSRAAPLTLIVLLGVVAVAGCQMPAFLSQKPQTRGNKLDADALKQLVPGTSTRADVTSLLGTPTARATFDDNQWLYIMQVTRPVIAGTQAVLDQTVYMLTFNSTGVLTDVSRRTLRDSEPVQVVDRATPSPGSETSFLQQLLGNVGKLSPGGGLGGPTGQQGSANNPGNF